MAMSGILVYFLCLLMAMNPAGAAQPAAGELLVKDVVVELNGETYDLGVDARLACAQEGEGANVEFALLDGEEKLFPCRMSVSPEEILCQLDGMTRSVKVDLASVEDADADKLREFAESLLAWQEVTKDLDAAALAGVEIPLDKGEAVAATAEFEGVTYDVESRTYTVTMEDAAAALETMMAQHPDFGEPLERLMNAALALEDEQLPEGGLPEYLRQSGIKMELNVVEAVNEAEGLEIDTATGVIRVESDEAAEFGSAPASMDLDVYSVVHGGRTHVGVDMKMDEGTSITVVMDTEETEEGVSMVMDMDLTESAEALIGEAEELQGLIEYAEEAETDEGAVDGADGISVDQSLAVRMHAESFRGVPDESGANDLRLSYDYDLGDGNTISMSFAGTEIERGLLGLEGSLNYAMRIEDTQLSVSAGVVYNADGGITVEPALADSVDVLAAQNGETTDEGLTTLTSELMAIAGQDSEKLMKKEGVAGLVSALSAVDFSQSAEEVYSEDYEDGEMYEDDSTEVHSIAEAEEVFGQALPLGDAMGAYSLESAMVGEDYLSAWYVNEDGEPMLSVSINKNADSSYYFVGADGAPERIEQPVYSIFGDEEDGYYYASWVEDGLSIDISAYNGFPWEEMSALISEINSAE